MTDQEKLMYVLTNYHLTLEYVGYETLPFVDGWSHYEALKLDPELFAHHEKEYEKFRRNRGR